MCAQRSRHSHTSVVRKRRLEVESLESRSMLSAGSVTVAAPVAGLLTITGDGNDDAVQVSGSTSDAGTFTIKGLHGTQVNGVANGSVTETGVTDIALAGWGDGNDFFGFTNKNTTGLAGGLSLTMGNGNDVVNLGTTNSYGGWGWGRWGCGGWGSGGNTLTKVGGDVQVTLGDGRDLVDAKNFSVTTTQGFLVTTGNGDDRVHADNVTVNANATSPVAGNQGFGIQMGDGNDSVDAYKVTVNADGTVGLLQGFGVQLGNGNNRFNAEKISVSVSGTVGGMQGFGVQMGDGNDYVKADSFTVTGGQGFAVDLGNGRDHVDLGNYGWGWGWGRHQDASNVTGEVLVLLGTGKDTVNAANITTGGDFDVEKTGSGGGGAHVSLSHVTVGTTATPTNLTVDLSGDTGTDELRVRHTTVSGTTTFSGGSNANNRSQTGHGNSFANPPVVTGFPHSH